MSTNNNIIAKHLANVRRIKRKLKANGYQFSEEVNQLIEKDKIIFPDKYGISWDWDESDFLGLHPNFKLINSDYIPQPDDFFYCKGRAIQMIDLSIYAVCDERLTTVNSYTWVYKHLVTGESFELSIYYDDGEITSYISHFSDEFIFNHLFYTSHVATYQAAKRKRKIESLLSTNTQK